VGQGLAEGDGRGGGDDAGVEVSINTPIIERPSIEQSTVWTMTN